MSFWDRFRRKKKTAKIYHIDPRDIHPKPAPPRDFASYLPADFVPAAPYEHSPLMPPYNPSSEMLPDIPSPGFSQPLEFQPIDFTPEEISFPDCSEALPDYDSGADSGSCDPGSSDTGSW